MANSNVNELARPCYYNKPSPLTLEHNRLSLAEHIAQVNKLLSMWSVIDEADNDQDSLLSERNQSQSLFGFDTKNEEFVNFETICFLPFGASP